MIEIKDKCDCCGCGACVQRCPKQCIAMHEDAEGKSIMPIDWNKVRNRKQELINKSLNFLINNLYER
jgi:Na+-translocating ferredoxin:NAD+ oxidoreductase RNF subunit RnfB